MQGWKEEAGSWAVEARIKLRARYKLGEWRLDNILTTSNFINMPRWAHLIRFLAVEDGQFHLGQLADTSRDIGEDSFNGITIKAFRIEGQSTSTINRGGATNLGAKLKGKP